MATNRRKTYVTTSIAVIFGAIVLVGFTVFHKTPAKQSQQAPVNYNTISDSSIGLSFNVSKNFKPIPKEELAAMNPGFTYGFLANDNSQTTCIVSTVALASGGTITSEQLRDGLLQEVKKVHPDATLANEATVLKPVKFGEAQGILLELLYTDGTTKVKRVEIIALGNANEVIAYCQSPSTDNARYYNDFTVFFSSLKLTH